MVQMHQILQNIRVPEAVIVRFDRIIAGFEIDEAAKRERKVRLL